MDYYYFFTLITIIISFFSRKVASVIAIIGAIYFLLFLPSLGFYSPDYFGYENAYETGFVVDEFPWISSNARIDAEVFYLRYTALIKVIFGYNFPFFLAFNYLFCLLLAYFFLRGFLTEVKQFFWVMFLPVLTPILFYFLIRSSISLFFVMLGFFTLIKSQNNKTLFWALLFTYVGFNMHSQYILISLLFIITYFLLRFKHLDDYHYNIRLIFTSFFILIGFLVFIRNFSTQLETIVDVFSQSDLAKSKLGYLEGEDNRGFRVTAILSLAVYPFMAYNLLVKTYWNPKCFILNDKLQERKFVFLLTAVVFYTASINIAYFDSTHLSSRLGRFSDYLCMAILVPTYCRVCLGHKMEYVAAFVLALITPFIYPSLYQDYYQSFEWNIF